MSSKSTRNSDFVLVVATRNRSQLLLDLLDNVNDWLRLPTKVYVVDSSDNNLELENSSYLYPLSYFKTSICSAAQQRNIGIDLALAELKEVSYIFFLDDDVRVQMDYPLKCISIFEEKGNSDVVGVSGVTNESEVGLRKRSPLLRLLGFTGRPSTVTGSVVNIAPSKIEISFDAEWLIGCSVWKTSVFSNGLTFERDFVGQSLFEDVIFSWRCRKFGRLICDPSIHLDHLSSPLERPNSRHHYRSWVVNRYRIFDYGFPGSKLRFFTLNIIICAYFLFKAFLRSKESGERFIGTCQGIKILICKERS